MPYVFRQGDLPKLDLQLDRGSEFEAWKSQWESYSSLSGLAEEAAGKQVQALTLCFSRDTLAIVQNLGLTEEQKGNAQAIIDAIQRYLKGHINESVERRNLRRRTQQHGESFDDFLVALRELVKTCNYCSNVCTEKHVRDQIIEGLLDGDTVEDLLQEADLTLPKAISICQAREAAKKQRANLATQQWESVAAVQRRQDDKPRSNHPTCPGCGAKPHPTGRNQCPAYNQTCHHCHKVGHFAKVCRSKGTRQLHPQPSTTGGLTAITADAPLLSGVHHTDPAPTIVVQICSANGSNTTEVLPDSGADISTASTKALHDLNEHVDNLLPSSIIPRAANGTQMHPIGRLPVTFNLENRTYQTDLHIFTGINGIIMSWKACKALSILPPCYPQPPPQTQPDIKALPSCSSTTIQVDQRTPFTQEQMIQEFPKVFDGDIKTMEGEQFHIYLTDDAKPFRVSTPRTIPFAYREKLKAELELLQKQNIIAPVIEATEWCAPIVVTPKKNTDSIRMCVDLSHLNRYVKRELYQSATPAEAVADISSSKAKFFTILDAMKGYHQCPLDPESQLLTTFITPHGRFKYRRAPYGISSISEHYNCRM